MNERISAGGVLYNPVIKKFYLINDFIKNEWKLPKGGVEEGENLIQTALREIREETGFENIEIKTSEPVFNSHYIFEENSQKISKKVYYFLVFTNEEIGKPTIEMKQENLKGGWFTYQEAINISTFNDSKEALNKAFKIIKINSKIH